MVDFLYSCSLQCSTQSISHSIYSLCHGTPAGSQLLVFSTKAHEGHVCSTVSALKQQSLWTAHAGLCHGACVTDAIWFFLWDHEQEEWGWITQGPCYDWVLGILLVSPTLLLLVPCCAWSSYARHFTEEKQVNFVSRAEVHSTTGGTMEETTREEFVESSWVFERGKDEEYLCVLREQDQPLAEDWLVWLQRELSRQTRNPDTTWSALARKWRACAILPCCSTWYPCYKCLWDLDRS